MARSRKKIDFESNLTALEAIVHQLEDGELSLEASLTAFEQGVKLTRECQSALDEAQQRVQILMAGPDDDARLLDFTPGGAEEGSAE
jgi:exodeoxyribonuclease VII small subunit